MSTRITFMGHSTVALESAEGSLITDPVFSNRILLLKRHGLRPTLPKNFSALKAILISHAHYDHLDLPSFKFFSVQTPIIIPPGLKKLLRFLPNPVIELEPGSTHHLSPTLKITAFPVTHTGFRISGFTYRASNGYLIEMEGQRLFFPGDTAYRKDFRSFKGVDAALLPIGPIEPAWFMRGRHLNPEDALQVVEDLEAKMMIPIHWGAFHLSWEPPRAPLEILRKKMAERNLADRVRILEIGEHWDL